MKGNKLGLVGRCLLAGGLVVGGASLNGCTKEEEAMIGKILGIGMQASPNASPDERTIGAMVDAGSQSSLDSYNARKMGTNVNVNVRQPKNQNNRSNRILTTPKDYGLSEAFFCEYYAPSETWFTAFKGIKNIFRSDDKIRAVSLWEVVNEDLNGNRVTLDILGIDTNKIAYNCGKIKEDPDNIIRAKTSLWSTHYDISAQEIKGKIGGNRFRAIWNLNGDPKKYADLTIIDAKTKEMEVEEYKKE